TPLRPAGLRSLGAAPPDPAGVGGRPGAAGGAGARRRRRAGPRRGARHRRAAASAAPDPRLLGRRAGGRRRGPCPGCGAGVVGALGVFLLAAWCVGRPHGAGPLTLTAAALVPAAPILALTQPGAALNDLAALAFYLAAIALVVNGDRGPGALGVAGVAAGLAI